MRDQIYHAFRAVWPGPTPQQAPHDLGLEHRWVNAHSVLTPSKGTIIVLLEGEIGEWMTAPNGRQAPVWYHDAGSIAFDVQGELRFRKRSAIVMLRNWQAHADLVSTVGEMRTTRLAATQRELASQRAETIKERAYRFIAEHPEVSSVVRIAERIGGSREMVALVMKERAQARGGLTCDS